MIQNFFFNSKRMTRDEFIEEYGMRDTPVDEQNQIIAQLIKRNVLKEIKEETPESKIFKKVQGDLIMDSKIEIIKEDKELQERFDKSVSESQQIIYPEVEIDVGSRIYADKLMAYARNLKVNSAIDVDDKGFYMVILYDVSEKSLSRVRMYMSAQKMGRYINSAAEKTASAATTVSRIAAQNILGPGGKAAIVATAKTLEEATKVTVELGSIAVNRSVEGYKSLKEELSTNEDVLRAARSFKNGFLSAMGSLKKSSSSGNGIRIK